MVVLHVIQAPFIRGVRDALLQAAVDLICSGVTSSAGEAVSTPAADGCHQAGGEGGGVFGGVFGGGTITGATTI